ncbi:phytanoyl-CoA dioxygenase family protein [Thalassospira sp.]|uniref:phytanoyl-CoA dioxygenase family protein n=1 Tax=Thalassospira sp. TaxID=1912094 RepID=UPI003AA865CA
MPASRRADDLEKITGFLRKIGIPVSYGTLPDQTFLPGILVSKGGLVIDQNQLLYPGDILHEAGHLAVMSPDRRATAEGNVGDDGGEEMAALAWSYAAACASGLPIDTVFHDSGYKGDGAWLREHFQTGGTIGVPLLMYFEMTARQDDTAAFPEMTQWLRQRPDPPAPDNNVTTDQNRSPHAAGSATSNNQQHNDNSLHHIRSAITPQDRALITNRLDLLCQNLLNQHRQGHQPANCLIDTVDRENMKPISKIFRIEQLLQQDPALALFFLGHPAVAGLGKQLCGPEAVPVYLSVQFRNRGETQKIIWHQDMIHDRQGPIYTVGLYLDDAWHDNGALRIIPDSHYERADIAQLSRVAELQIQDNAGISSRSIAVNAGDILAHDVMLVHCSDAMTHTDCRRTLYVEFRHPQQAHANPTMTAHWIAQQQALLENAQEYCAMTRKTGTFGDVPIQEKAPENLSAAYNIRLENAHYG